MSDTELSPEAQKILDESSGFTRDPKFLTQMATRDSVRDTWYRTYHDYYSGENHRVRLTDRVKRFLQQSGFMWCENFCEVVVDAMCERMVIEKVTSDDEEIDTWVDEFLKQVRFDELQAIVKTNVAIKGDGYVIVDLDTRLGQPTMHWNRPEIIKPIYDSEHPDVILFAAKVWKSKLETPTNPSQIPVLRMNLYFADRCEKWFNSAPDGGGTWAKHLDTEDSAWPIPWTDTGELDGEPLGVPVFHFRNKALGGAMGTSEIRNTIPQQDALNKNIVDLHMVLDELGAPKRWGTGVKTDERKSLTGSAGVIWTSSNSDAKFGQFNGADPTGMLAALEASLQRLAGRSRTPLFLLVLSGDAPSGESLKTAETGLVAKVKDRCVPMGNKWEDVIVMCAKVAQTQGDLKSKDIIPDLFEVIWADAESRNVLEQHNALSTAVTSLGLSKHTALLTLGYDPDEETEWKDEETAKAVANFDRGLPTVPVIPNGNGKSVNDTPPIPVGSTKD